MTTQALYKALCDSNHANSVPIDVADAAVSFSNANHNPYQEIAKLQTVDGNAVNPDSTARMYRVKDTGAVLLCKNRKAAFAFPAGRVDEVINTVCENTDYIVVEREE